MHYLCVTTKNRNNYTEANVLNNNVIPVCSEVYMNENFLNLLNEFKIKKALWFMPRFIDKVFSSSMFQCFDKRYCNSYSNPLQDNNPIYISPRNLPKH